MSQHSLFWLALLVVLLVASPPGLHQAARPAQAGLEPSAFTPAAAGVTGPDPVIQSMIDQVLSTTVRQYDGDLSGAWPVDIRGEPFTIVSRYTYSGLPIWKATVLVEDHLEALGLQVERQVWGSVSSPNVIGELRGETRPEDIFVIGAHLDDAPFDYVAPGADDNASGCTAVLIAADILSQYRWGSTLRFVLWTGEEQWSMEEYYAHGSRAYARRSRSMGENIVGVLDLDMIGWNTPGGQPDIILEATPSLSPSVQLAFLFADVIDRYDLNLVPHIQFPTEGLGDHGSFWDEGYPAIMGIEYLDGDFNPNYHTVADKLDTLDLVYFTEFVKAGVGTFAHMCDCLIPDSFAVYLPVVLSGAP